ncbi:DUF896 domain-containing protein [Selenomonas sp.]|jgi:uncharacterized protein YnzC (UPF0291/DUF896 family)|uniref:DUF896 domain-containing protein n=1 Tax=Selenomonas sp. TaxID=2053611 RepID=UPI0025FD3CAF|nr:DUF896 domain-containing protein [Selenomonas sp.]MBQ1866700.1 DUF896 domain-containing protein [Selenomonas sp.]MDD6120092.1 DUF896 domain-containing protein [Selenomonadaceae bacterium]MDD7055795.1 DUF896 domain-containing protein [Selenomonadaceae bacterium]MDY3915474.1 DUF896 domain-containing protein [Selenomonadaceae bacterium]
MITKELIARINALSRKQRSTGLTPAEKQEQKKLRQAYLADIRGQLKGMLDNIEFVDAPQKREPSIIQTGEVSFSLRRTEIKE